MSVEGHDTKLTLAYLKNHTKTCGNRVGQTPKRRAIAPTPEMIDRGYKDYREYAQQEGEPFPINCSPAQLEELGSGTVLYFEFLILLGLLLFVMFVIQVLIMAQYSDHDWIAGWHENPALVISTNWLTPGNLGPDQADSPLVPTLCTLCVILLGAFIWMSYQRLVVADHKVDVDTTCPNDFALLVHLPKNATDVKKIEEFFKINAIEGREDTEIVKAVIGWDPTDYEAKKREREQLSKQRAELEQEDAEAKEIQKKIQSISAGLQSSGCVVVIFRYQSDLHQCLARWTHFWAYWAYSDATDTCVLPAGYKVKKGTSLPKFAIGSGPDEGSKIQVKRAPNPGDINWHKFGIPGMGLRQAIVFMIFRRSLPDMTLLSTSTIMFVLICFACLVTWGSNELRKFLEESEIISAYQFLGMILPAVAVLCCNVGLSVAARVLAEKENHEAKTVEMFSQALKMSIGMIINTAGAIYITNPQPSQWYTSDGLIVEVFTVLMINSVMPSFCQLLDVPYIMKCRKRRRATPEVIDKLDAELEALSTDESPTIEEKRKQKVAEAKLLAMEEAYAPSALNEPRRYAMALKITICCIVYMPVLPWLSLVGILGISLQYWIDKYLLLRWYRRVDRQSSKEMALFSIKFLKFVAPAALTLSTWRFLTPSWRDKWQVYDNILVSGGVAAFFIVLPLSVWTAVFYRLCRAPPQAKEDDYYKAQDMRSMEMKYHKDQFVYKKLSEEKNPEMLCVRSPGPCPCARCRTMDHAHVSLGVDVVPCSYGAATS